MKQKTLTLRVQHKLMITGASSVWEPAPLAVKESN